MPRTTVELTPRKTQRARAATSALMVMAPPPSVTSPPPTKPVEMSSGNSHSPALPPMTSDVVCLPSSGTYASRMATPVG